MKPISFTGKETLVFLAGMLILLFPALYNSFPLVTSDTGAYIDNAYRLYVPDDRSITYSIFIRLTCLSYSLWFVVAAQSIVLLFFLRVVVAHFCKEIYTPFVFLGIILTITVCTSAGWFCGQLMPDIFTAVLLLAIITWLLIPIEKKWMSYLLIVFIWGCIIMHNSHVVISFLTAAFLAIYYRRKKLVPLFKKSIVLLATSVVAYLTLCSVNAISGKGFRPSSSTHVFLMCRMVESGIMDRFLRENCDRGEYKLCEYRDKLPDRQWDFQWSPESPLYLAGGWKANEAEYNKIFLKTLTRPKYLALHIFKSGQATLRQLPLIYVGDGLTFQTSHDQPYIKIQGYFPDELREFRSSRQECHDLSFGFFNIIIVIFSFAVIALFLFSYEKEKTKNRMDPLWDQLLRIVILFILFNAFVTASLSTVVGRFQSRVFWILPTVCFLYLLNRHHQRRAAQNKALETTPDN